MLFKLLTHAVLALAALLAVPNLIELFATQHQNLADPLTALAVALTLIPVVKPYFD